MGVGVGVGLRINFGVANEFFNDILHRQILLLVEILGARIHHKIANEP